MATCRKSLCHGHDGIIRGNSVGGQSWRNRRLMLDGFRLDVAMKRWWGGDSAEWSHWPEVILISPRAAMPLLADSDDGVRRGSAWRSAWSGR